MPSQELWLLSVAALLSVLVVVLTAHFAARPPAPGRALASLRVRDLDAARGRCGISAAAFVRAMPAYHQRQYQALRRHTATGGGVLALPDELKAALVAEYRRRRPHGRREAGPNFVAYGAEALRPTMIELSGSAALQRLATFLARELQAWAGAGALEHTATYGIREYHRGARLEQHVDRPHTHVISAIEHVAAEDLEHEWPLHLLPHDAAEVCAVGLRDLGADVLFYESATVPHGRLEPLAAAHYANIFTHYRPFDWAAHADAALGKPLAE